VTLSRQRHCRGTE